MKSNLKEFLTRRDIADPKSTMEALDLAFKATIVTMETTKGKFDPLVRNLYFLYSANRMFDLSVLFEDADFVGLFTRDTPEVSVGELIAYKGRQLPIVRSAISYGYDLQIYVLSGRESLRLWHLGGRDEARDAMEFLDGPLPTIESFVLTRVHDDQVDTSNEPRAGRYSAGYVRFRLAEFRIRAREVAQFFKEGQDYSQQDLVSYVSLARSLYDLIPEIVQVARIQFGPSGARVPDVLEKLMGEGIRSLEVMTSRIESSGGVGGQAMLPTVLSTENRILAGLRVLDLTKRVEVALLRNQVPVDFIDPFNRKHGQWWGESAL